MWERSVIQDLWKRVIHIVSLIIDQDVPLSPKLCIFQIFPDELKIQKKKRILLD